MRSIMAQSVETWDSGLWCTWFSFKLNMLTLWQHLKEQFSPETCSTVEYIIVQYSEYNVFADS